MEKLHRDILSVLSQDDIKLTLRQIKSKLVADLGYEEDVKQHLDHLSSRIQNAVDVLDVSHFVVKSNGRRAGVQFNEVFVGITNAGRSELKLGYRVWQWFKSELQAALTLVALGIGLLAFFGIDWDWFQQIWTR